MSAGGGAGQPPPAHPRGSSKYGLGRTVRVLLDLFTVKFLHSYGTRPAHLFGLMGLASFGLGFAVLVYLAVLKVSSTRRSAAARCCCSGRCCS